jgi:hypothetical protein
LKIISNLIVSASVFMRFAYRNNERIKDMINWLKTLLDTHAIIDLAKALASKLKELLPLEPRVIPLLEYDDVFAYFIERSPRVHGDVRGAMIVEEHAQGVLFIQCFIDSQDRPICRRSGVPYGRQLVVKQFDEELTDIFDGQDLVIVE